MNRHTLSFAVLFMAGCQTTHSERSQVVVMEPHEGDHLWFFHESADELGSGGELQILLDSESHPEAGASFARFTLGVGGALPLHRHDETEEFTYIISGEGAAIALDENGDQFELPIRPGCFWYIPSGAWHSVRNTGQTPLALVFAIVPNDEQGLLSFFRKIGVTPGNEGIVIADDELERLGREHDMIFRDAFDDED